MIQWWGIPSFSGEADTENAATVSTQGPALERKGVGTLQRNEFSSDLKRISLRCKDSTLLMQAWNLTGDAHTKQPGSKAWIAEMYGYAFAAAKANVWHNPADYFHWMYPGFFTYGDARHTMEPSVDMLPLTKTCQHQSALRAMPGWQGRATCPKPGGQGLQPA
jgi:hypothetical protein